MTFINDKTFKEFHIGDSAHFKRTINQDDVDNFIKLSGDVNPLHYDERYAATTNFKKPIVHGMFLGALCSTLVGVYLPGRRCLYLSQNLLFKQPVFIGDTLIVSGKIQHITKATRFIEINIEIKKQKAIVACGTAQVQVLD